VESGPPPRSDRDRQTTQQRVTVTFLHTLGCRAHSDTQAVRASSCALAPQLPLKHAVGDDGLQDVTVIWHDESEALGDSSDGTVTISDESTDIVAGLSPLSGPASSAHAAIASTNKTDPETASSDFMLVLLLLKTSHRITLKYGILARRCIPCANSKTSNIMLFSHPDHEFLVRTVLHRKGRKLLGRRRAGGA